MEIWIPVIVAVVTSSLSFFGAVFKGKNDLKSMKEDHERELDKMKEAHTLDLERMQSEIDGQASLYERNKQTDAVGEMFSTVMRNPGMQSILTQQIAEALGGQKK